MKRLLTWLTIVAGSLLLIATIALASIWIAFPRDIEVESLDLDDNPDLIERGRYLVEHVAFCWSCHAQRDWTRYSAPVMAGTRGQGGSDSMFGDEGVNARNITPYGIGDWSDGEIKRVITTGIARDGHPVHPQMPYFTYRKMSESDVHGVIAYLRTLEPIEHEPPPSQKPLWVKAVGRILPRPYQPRDEISPDDTAAYGRYLVRIAECRACHLPSFDGGFPLVLPDGSEVKSENLLARLQSYTRDEFITLFKSRATRRPIPPGKQNTPMPWQHYAGMTEADLGAIYDYVYSISRN